MADALPRRVLPVLGDPALFDGRWPDAPYHLVGSATGLRRLLDWPAVDAILNDQVLRVPAFRMAKDNELLPITSLTRPDRATTQAVKGIADPVRVAAELGRGATLVLQGLHQCWPPLRAVTRRLAGEVGHPVFVNAYLTPRSERGFGAHHDPYHAWLVQAEGAKSWRLWAPDRDPAVDRPDLDVVLAEGDVLWIPRGWWHTGGSGDRPSLHLTITVRATKATDVLHAVVDDLACRAELVRELPPNALLDADSATSTVSDVVAEVVRLIAELEPAALADRITAARLAQFDPLPARPVAAVLHDDGDPVFHTHPEGVLHSATDKSSAQLRTADSVVTMALDQLPACRELVSGDAEFRLDEVGGAVTEELLDQLVDARLVCAGPCRRAEVP
jgi:lysine-specific demethylase/histidyl-hydroxylase NO66